MPCSFGAHRFAMFQLGCLGALLMGTVCARAALPQQDDPSSQKRIPRQMALKTAVLDGMVRDQAELAASRGIGGATITIRNLASGEMRQASTDAEGVFRLLNVPPGRYELRVEAPGYEGFEKPEIVLAVNELVTLEIALKAGVSVLGETSRLPRQPELGAPLPSEQAPPLTPYRELRRRLDTDPHYVENPAPATLPPASAVFAEMPDRWNVTMPDWKPSGRKAEYPYLKGAWGN